MDKDIVFAIFLIVILLIFYFLISPSKSENFAQEDGFEPETAFDSSLNNLSGDENHGRAFNDEGEEKSAPIPEKKAQVIVFLSKQCPHCVDYNKDSFTRLKGKLAKLGNGNIIVKKVYADKDPNGLFNKYEVKYVPTGVVIHNNKNSKINGEISPVNSLKTIKSLSTK
jgi:thioredoxin-related protein